MTAVPFVFGPKFQNSMLSLMLRDLSFTSRVIKFVENDHLHSDAHKWVFDEIKKKYLKAGIVPSQIEIESGLKKVEKHKVKLYRQFVGEIYKQLPEDPEYIREQLSEFARRANFNDLFSYSQVLYNGGKADEAYRYVLEQINHLHAISFKDDQTVSVTDFEDIRQRFVQQRVLTVDRISTGIPALDTILRGGLSRLEGEFAVIVAEPKKGKSIALIHMGASCLLKNFKCRVAHFVLEGSTETTIFRYQSRLSGIPEERIASDELTPEEQTKLHKIGKRFMGRLELIPFNTHWEYTTTDIESKLAELDRKGMTPDLIVIDYADLLLPREKSREERMNQREVYRELKRLALMRKCAIWTASQAQRPKDDGQKESLLKANSIAETYEKVRIADFIGTLNQTPKEQRMGVLRFHADIYRNNACDKTFRLLVDFERMIFHHSRYGHLDIGDMPDWMRSKGKKR